MNTFSTYLRLGYEHITNLSAADHLLFIVVLMAVYQSKNWLKLVLAVSFFTLGHSLTLTLSTLDLITISTSLIEFLIPVTILFTALYNLTKAGQNQNSKTKYWIAGAFGLIHGLGFANYYDMLMLGDSSYWEALLPFNLGVELGQLLIVLVFLLLMIVFQRILNVKTISWNLFFSGVGFGLALQMCYLAWPF